MWQISTRSYGVIAFHIRYGEVYYLLVQRRFSYSYSDVLFGRWGGDLDFLIKNMTKTERNQILSRDYNSLINEFLNRKFKNSKFMTLIEQNILTCRDYILYLVRRYSNYSPQLQFEFPKGLMQKSESEEFCAIREFREETAFSGRVGLYCGIKPMIESYIGTDGRWYMSKYFFTKFDHMFYPNVDFSVDPPKLSHETSGILWVSASRSRLYLNNRRYNMLLIVDAFIKRNIRMTGP